MASTKLRNHLSLQVKIEICKMAAADRTMQPSELGQWATATFQPGLVIDRHVVRRALKMQDKLLALPAVHYARKIVPSDTMLQVDAAAVAYIRKVVVESPNKLRARLLCKKVRKIRGSLGVAPEKIGKVTKSWATHFMRRTDMSYRRLYGESGSVRRALVDKGRDEMKTLTQSYHPDDIFNFDESSYFYRRGGNYSIAPNDIDLHGTKDDKTRVTLAVGTDCSGTERLPLLIVGTAKMPVPFRDQAHRIHWVGDKTRQPMPPQQTPLFHYAPSLKAWMNGVIFRAWLRELDERMRFVDRHILLLVDNVSSHRVGEIGLTHVRLEFLHLGKGLTPKSAPHFMKSSSDAADLFAKSSRFRGRKSADLFGAMWKV